MRLVVIVKCISDEKLKMNSMQNHHSASLQSLSLKRQHDLDTLRGIILSWNSSRLDLFELSLPNENLQFSGKFIEKKLQTLNINHVFRRDAVLLPAS